MPLSRSRTTAALLLTVAGTGASAAALPVPSAGAAATPRLERVAAFPHQVTGVTVSRSNRVFVNFPRWTEDAPVSVAEVRGGRLRPYPNAGWNAWRNTRIFRLSAARHFVCVQSVVVDHHDHLWVLDAAAPAQEREVPGGPKLVEISLATNRVIGVIPFGLGVAPQGSYLNDVRFSPDDRHAYITDSGARGALLVVDLVAGTARRVLDGDPRTQVQRNVVVHADGRPLRRPDGRGVQFAADGIALSRDGSTLYWQALSGRTLYRVPTAALRDARLPASRLAARVRRVGTNGVADGLLIDSAGTMFVTAPQVDAVRVRRGGSLRTYVQSPLLRWPDTLAEGPDGAVYVTTSHIQDMSWFRPADPIRLPTELWRIRPATP